MCDFKKQTADWMFFPCQAILRLSVVVLRHPVKKTEERRIFNPRASACRSCGATSAHLMKLNWFEVAKVCSTRCMAVSAKDFGTHLGGATRESSARGKKTPA